MGFLGKAKDKFFEDLSKSFQGKEIGSGSSSSIVAYGGKVPFKQAQEIKQELVGKTTIRNAGRLLDKKQSIVAYCTILPKEQAQKIKSEMVENTINRRNDMAMVVRGEPQMMTVMPNNTSVVQYTGDRNNPVEIKKRKDIKGKIAWRKNIGPKEVELHKTRPDVLGMRRKFDYETFVPALRGQKFIRGRPLIRDVREVGLIEGDVPLADE